MVQIKIVFHMNMILKNHFYIGKKSELCIIHLNRKFHQLGTLNMTNFGLCHPVSYNCINISDSLTRGFSKTCLSKNMTEILPSKSAPCWSVKNVITKYHQDRVCFGEHSISLTCSFFICLL